MSNRASISEMQVQANLYLDWFPQENQTMLCNLPSSAERSGCGTFRWLQAIHEHTEAALRSNVTAASSPLPLGAHPGPI